MVITSPFKWTSISFSNIECLSAVNMFINCYQPKTIQKYSFISMHFAVSTFPFIRIYVKYSFPFCITI